MRFKSVGNKRDDVCLVVRNADTVALLPGQAAILNFPFTDNTKSGVDVVGYLNAQTNFSAVTAQALLYGVVISPGTSGGIPVNGYGEVQAFGYCPNVQLTLATRASTNSTWPSYAAINATAGIVGLYAESLANGFTTGAIQSFRTDAISTGNQVAFTQFLAPMILGGTSIASFTTGASSVQPANTALTISVNAFVRIL